MTEPVKTKDYITFPVNIPNDVHEALRDLAHEGKVSMHKLIKGILAMAVGKVPTA